MHWSANVIASNLSSHACSNVECQLLQLCTMYTGYKFNSRQILYPPKFSWMSFNRWTNAKWSLNVYRQNGFVQDLFTRRRPTLPRKITCELSILTQKDLEKANAKVKCSIEHEATESILPPTTESTYSCTCDGLEHNSLVQTLPWLRFSHFSWTTCGLLLYEMWWCNKNLARTIFGEMASKQPKINIGGI